MMADDASTLRDNDELSRLVATMLTERNSISSDDDDDASVIHNKLTVAISNVSLAPIRQLGVIIIQFWAPVKTATGESLLLSTSGQPFSLDPRLDRYRLGSVQCQYDVNNINNDNDYKLEDDRMIISNGPPAIAFLNRFPEVVMNLRLHKGLGRLLNKAKSLGLTSLILLPVFHQSTCVGVVECCMRMPHIFLIFKDLKLALERVGLSTYPVQECLPYKTLPGFKTATDEIKKALKIVCESHHLSLAQVWISSESVNHVSSSLGDSQTKQGMFVVKVCGYYCVDSDNDNNDDRFKNYYDTCDVLPLKKGEGIPVMALEESNEPRLYINLTNLRLMGLLGLLSRSTRCSCFVICLRSTHTQNVDYAFEFLWPKSRNHFILLESLLLTLQTCLPTFKLASGAQLDDELRVLDVQNFTSNGNGYFKILEQNKLSAKPLEEEFRGPKAVKRKLNQLTESDAKVTPNEFNSASYWGGDDERLIVADYQGRVTAFILESSSYTLANIKKKIEEKFNLKPETYMMEVEFLWKKVKLNTDDDVAFCIKLWTVIKRKFGENIQFFVHVLPSVG